MGEAGARHQGALTPGLVLLIKRGMALGQAHPYRGLSVPPSGTRHFVYMVFRNCLRVSHFMLTNVCWGLLGAESTGPVLDPE